MKDYIGIDDLKIDRNVRLNRLAGAIAKTEGRDGYLPLSARYRAAELALGIVEEWERTPIVPVTPPVQDGAKQ